MLTERQQQVLDYIKSTVEDRGYPPSVREIGDAVGLSSPSSVHAQLNSLVQAGMIKKDPSKPRAIMITDETPAVSRASERQTRDVPVLGRIAAGTPILAAEHVDLAALQANFRAIQEFLSGSRLQAPGPRPQAPGLRLQASGSRPQAPGPRHLVQSSEATR